MERKIPRFSDMGLGERLGDRLDKYEKEIYEPALYHSDVHSRLDKAQFLLDFAQVEKRIDERFRAKGYNDDAQTQKAKDMMARATAAMKEAQSYDSEDHAMSAIE